jgi:hypothetical protein
MSVPPIPVAHLRLVEPKRIDLYEHLSTNDESDPIADARVLGAIILGLLCGIGIGALLTTGLAWIIAQVAL